MPVEKIDIRKQIEGIMTADKFSGLNGILVRNFLCAFKTACGYCDVSEPTALRVLKHFSWGHHAERLPRVAFGHSRRGVDSVLSNYDALPFNYVTDLVLSDAFRAFQRMRQGPSDTKIMLVRRVREEARLMLGVFDEVTIIAQLIDGVEPNVRSMLQERLNEEPNLYYQAITQAAQNYAAAKDGTQTPD